MTDLASLLLKVDSTQVKDGVQQLDGLTSAGKRAEAQAGKIRASHAFAARAVERFAQATSKMGSSTNSATAQASRMVAQAGLARHHIQNLTFQVNDLAMGLASGQNPMRVFIQQGAQIAQIGQQAGVGLGGMLRAVLRLVAPFAGLAAVAGALGLALKGVRDSAASDSELKQFASTLGLTKQEMKDLEDVTVTWGDTMLATFDVLAQRAGTSTSEIKGVWAEAMQTIGEFGKFSVAVLLGAFAGLVKGIASAFVNLGKIVAMAVSGAANFAIGVFEDMLNRIIGGVNRVAGFFGMGSLSEVSFGRVNAKFNLSNPLAEARDQMFDTFNDVQGGFDKISARASERARDRLRKQADEMIDDRPNKKDKKERAKKAKDDPIAKEIAQLEQQIAALHRLAEAYRMSDEAALRAEAMSKAEEKALRLKTDATRFYAQELELLARQSAVEGAKQINDMRFEADARTRLNDLVAAGVMNAGRAQMQLELENRLRPLIAAAAVAEGRAKQQILDIVRELTQEQTRLNDQMVREQYLREKAANDNEIERLRLEVELIGASNRERAVAIAQLEAMQRAREGNMTPEQQQDLVRQEIEKANLSVRTPFQEWAATIPQTAQAINEAMQGIAVRGFDGLANAITDVLTGTQSLKSAFKDLARSIIADIVQMTVRMLIFRAVSSVLGGLFRGSPGSINSQLGDFGGGWDEGGSVLFPNARGNVFARGNVIPFARGGLVDSPTLFPMRGGRTGLMGEAGPEAIMPLTRDNRGRLGVRTANEPQQIVVHVNASEEFDVKVEQVAGRTMARHAPAMGKAIQTNIVRSLNRPRLNN